MDDDGGAKLHPGTRAGGGHLCALGVSASLASCLPAPAQVATPPAVDTVRIATPASTEVAPEPEPAASQSPRVAAPTCPEPTGQADTLRLDVERIPLPKVETIRHIRGAGGQAVWMLGLLPPTNIFSREAVIHYDGRRVQVKATCVCCDHPEAGSTPDSPVLFELWIRGSDVQAFGQQVGPIRQSPVVAAPGKSGRWSCNYLPKLEWSTIHTYVRSPSELWSLDFRHPFRLHPTAAVRAPDLPEEFSSLPVVSRIEPAFVQAWFLKEPIRSEPRAVFEYRDARWIQHELPEPKALEGCPYGVGAGWIDDQGRPWNIFRQDSMPHAHSHFLGHWNGTTWDMPAVSKSFKPDRIVATDSGDLWFLGPATIAHWEGDRLAEAVLPLREIAAAWAAQDGTVWAAGKEPGDSDGMVLLRLRKAGAVADRP